jgi:hypothetical protein
MQENRESGRGETEENKGIEECHHRKEVEKRGKKQLDSMGRVRYISCVTVQILQIQATPPAVLSDEFSP